MSTALQRLKLTSSFPFPPSQGGTPVIFSYTGSAQSYIVPTAVTSMWVHLWGAGGGGGGNTDAGAWNGGAGAYVTGILAVTPGETLRIIVGLGGSNNTTTAGSLDQGGGGAAGNPPNNCSSGGGRSAIQRGVNNDIVVAGGGSGSGWRQGAAATWFGTSGAGTSVNGLNGGGGGTQIAGGAAGPVSGYNPSTAGSKGQGGNGGGYASGGGGGWYGGGGGGVSGGNGGTGGAGSSYIDLLSNPSGENGSVPTAPATGSLYYGEGAAVGGRIGGPLTGGNGRIVLIPILPSTVPYTIKLNNIVPVQLRATFTYTGADQTYVVPTGVTSMRVYLWGAGGGGGLAGGGGAGAMVQGVLAVTPGETLTIVVGQAGDGLNRNEAGRTYGGGGQGGAGDALFNSRGGGRSAIRRSGADIVTVGAGGGGRGVRGGKGGLTNGFAPSSGTATGGTQSAGGNTGGALNLGGNSVADNNGGGGSGYYGGGGGPGQDQPGAGGSSLTSNLTLIPGETVFGFESTDGALAPNTSSPYYQANVGVGGIAGTASVRGGTGGNGLVVMLPNTATSPGVYSIVFRPPPFTPTQIAGLQMWLDAADSNSINSTGSAVSVWSDKSGNNRNLSGSGPLYQYYGGYPNINVNGAQNFLWSGSVNLQSVTAYIVLSYQNRTTDVAPFQAGNDSNDINGFIFFAFNNSGIPLGTVVATTSVYSNGDYSNFLSGTYPQSTTTELIPITIVEITISAQNAVKLFMNGALNAQNSFNTTRGTNLTRIQIGGRYWAFTGRIYEVILYNSVLAEAPRQQVEGYLAWKWGLQSKLPDNHPYKNTKP